MKRIYLVLLLAAVLLSISAVSATDDMSVSNDTLEIDNVDEMPLQNQTDVNQDDESQSGDSSATETPTDNVANDTKKVQVPSKATSKNVKSTYGTPAKFTVKLTDQDGDAIADKQVTFKVNDKVYKIKTNSNGIATLKLNYKAGKYTITYSVAGFKGENTYTVNNKITLTILKWGNKGDVSKVKLIRKNMPKNKWVKEAVAATKKGNPLLKFQGGKGKTVFITAGVHGNELSSQVAAMKMIDYLSKHPIKGTVYVIPFVNIKAITHKVRHTGTDYNRVAHKSGTISNKIVKLVSKYDCDAYGDFHTTQPGGVPGKDIVMGSKSPAKKCKAMTNYIAKHAKVHKKIYKYAGEQFPGALADNVNKKGIRAVICEVMLPHNTVTAKTVKTSYSMMKALLKYNSVI
ncbi:MAG: succinylglutamate desuccinylase/aspartoacylase family protein [Methanobrevibacter sp.]|nr:succinylglutamate desuccinylase/aspartoacylase family protein [Methanobrevibacter sp.]